MRTLNCQKCEVLWSMAHPLVCNHSIGENLLSSLEMTPVVISLLLTKRLSRFWVYFFSLYEIWYLGKGWGESQGRGQNVYCHAPFEVAKSLEAIIQSCAQNIIVRTGGLQGLVFMPSARWPWTNRIMPNSTLRISGTFIWSSPWRLKDFVVMSNIIRWTNEGTKNFNPSNALWALWISS